MVGSDQVPDMEIAVVLGMEIAVVLDMEIAVVLDTVIAAVLAAVAEAACCTLIAFEDREKVCRATVGVEMAHIAEHSRNHTAQEWGDSSAVEGPGRG
jgi:hypothetical protein